MRYVKKPDSSLLLLPSLITELYRRLGVEEYSKETWVHPKNPIYPLKIQGEGVFGNSKKRKIDLEKSTYKDMDSFRPSIIGSFEEIIVEIRTIMELVFGFSIEPRGPSSTRHSYVS